MIQVFSHFPLVSHPSCSTCWFGVCLGVFQGVFLLAAELVRPSGLLFMNWYPVLLTQDGNLTILSANGTMAFIYKVCWYSPKRPWQCYLVYTWIIWKIVFYLLLIVWVAVHKYMDIVISQKNVKQIRHSCFVISLSYFVWHIWNTFSHAKDSL